MEVELQFENEYPTTINTPPRSSSRRMSCAAKSAERYQELPKPVSGSEDFSRVLAEVPGAFLMIGATPPGRVVPQSAPINHSPRADFEPAVLSDAAAVYAGLAARKLHALAQEATS